MPLNLPNLLTWLRIFLVPLLVLIYYLPADSLAEHNRNIVAAGIFGLAAVTDWLDGWLARTLGQTSPFGAFLDPVADKLMVVTALIVLVSLKRCDVFIAVIIVGREIAISALREWMAKIGEGRSVAVAMIGKLKTVSQMVAILLLLYHDPLLRLDTALVGTWLIYLAAALTLWSMVYYLRRAPSRIWQA
jgi:CDP-diacylglycerol--glycerol-3-phosphate 3-phosphatidyltransferase/cardiolipin synthase